MGILRLRKDLFSENLSNTENEPQNIQEGITIFAVPAPVEQNRQLMKIPIRKNMKIRSSKVDTTGMKEESDDKIFSKDMKDACKVRCKICDGEIVMSSMSKHTRGVHCLLLKAYKELYGDHKETIIKKTFHKCGLCEEVMLLDVLEIAIHLRRGGHNMLQKEYNARFMCYKVINSSVKIEQDFKVKHRDKKPSLKREVKNKHDLRSLSAEQLLQ